jgi:hypothetical protein
MAATKRYRRKRASSVGKTVENGVLELNDTDYSKLFGLSFAAVFAFLLALNAIALSNVSQQIGHSQSDLRAGDSMAARR